MAEAGERARPADRLDIVLAAFSRKHGLSPREAEVLGLGARGLSSKAIADGLQLDHRTVATYWGRVYVKLGCETPLQAVAEVLRFAMEGRGPRPRQPAVTSRRREYSSRRGFPA